jgi:hypothetical protein
MGDGGNGRDGGNGGVRCVVATVAFAAYVGDGGMSVKRAAEKPEAAG